MAEQQTGEKTEDATPKRRQDARKKGTVAKSTDLTGAVTLFAAAFIIPSMVQNFGQQILGNLFANLQNAPNLITPGAIIEYSKSIVFPLFLAILPLLAVLVVTGIAINLTQVGFVLSAEPMKPTAEKINPLNGLKRMFSRRGAVEGLKATAKLGVFTWIVYAIISAEWSKISLLSTLPPADGAAVLGQILHTILIRIAFVWLVIAAADYFFQRKDTEKQLKMTKYEVKREMKEQEGSPELKMAIARNRQKLLKGGMASKLSEATVLVTNPTHFAVAIKYERNSMHSPMVVAKGQDFLALKMREIAANVDLPIVENKPLARGLYAQCEPGDFVPRDLFAPVAEVLAYVIKTTEEAKSKGQPKQKANV